jgi:metal-responsive CopG/Arc/MetJ family transcriptional regulator
LTLKYYPGYTESMKTAISIPDPIFQAADSLASRLGVSRSEFYAKAIEAFIEQNKNQDVTVRLNQVFVTESNSLGDDYYNLQRQSLSKEEW